MSDGGRHPIKIVLGNFQWGGTMVVESPLIGGEITNSNNEKSRVAGWWCSPRDVNVHSGLRQVPGIGDYIANLVMSRPGGELHLRTETFELYAEFAGDGRVGAVTMSDRDPATPVLLQATELLHVLADIGKRANVELISATHAADAASNGTDSEYVDALCHLANVLMRLGRVEDTIAISSELALELAESDVRNVGHKGCIALATCMQKLAKRMPDSSALLRAATALIEA